MKTRRAFYSLKWIDSLVISVAICLLASFALLWSCQSSTDQTKRHLLRGFTSPPDSVRPGVYWYFMDGNLSRQAMTADLESMKHAGIGQVIFLEVNVGVPRGPVDFLSEEWQDLFKHAVKETERLGIELTLGVGPGWTGSGGPWVKPEQSMQHLVAGSIQVVGPVKVDAVLPVPKPRRPFFGERVFTESLRQQWESYYKDVLVLAFPTPSMPQTIMDSDEKALYYRAPYTSQPGVKPFLPASAHYPPSAENAVIDPEKVRDLTDHLDTDGRFQWEAPAGNWTIMRFGMRNNGAVTRPAPIPGLGFECNKFSATDFDEHFEAYIGKLISKVGPRKKRGNTGWTMLHMDSWEMGAQNWTAGFREIFKAHRGYDPLRYLPTYTGLVVTDLEQSERFLWDVRWTAQEMVLEQHAMRIKTLGRRHGFGLSIEPYDMNPCADLDLGALADVPMCEFWSIGFGFNAAFSCIEAASIAHIMGRPVVAAEAFTADSHEAWQLYPGAIKNQGDWAFCAGVNRLVYHTFAHKPLNEKLRPGMTMGPYGVHWDRGQTWWPLASAYHEYISRCSFLLQQGVAVADILYLTPEGAPHVFRPPSSAMAGNDTLPDRLGYNFDGCSPALLMAHASVQDQKVIFPGGACYRLLVLPNWETMTPELLDKIESLVAEGAVVIGNPPQKSPSLVNYPQCDVEVRSKAQKLWGDLHRPQGLTERQVGKGRIICGNDLVSSDSSELYPDYQTTAALLKKMAVLEDFESNGPIRYIHRRILGLDLFFVSNRDNRLVDADCVFRIYRGSPELWDPLTGQVRSLPNYDWQEGRTRVPLRFEAHQSFFIVFDKSHSVASGAMLSHDNFPEIVSITDVTGPWTVAFDPHWGGPKSVMFDQLEDWTHRPEEGIRYYSGIAVYRNTFDLLKSAIASAKTLYLNFSEINGMARVLLNGKELGVLWTAPWRVEMTDAVKPTGNQLEIQIANLWPNRLIGDEQFPDDGVKNQQWPDWLRQGQPRTSGRYTFTTHRYYKKDSPLISSGLTGAVRICATF